MTRLFNILTSIWLEPYASYFPRAEHSFRGGGLFLDPRVIVSYKLPLQLIVSFYYFVCLVLVYGILPHFVNSTTAGQNLPSTRSALKPFPIVTPSTPLFILNRQDGWSRRWSSTQEPYQVKEWLQDLQEETHSMRRDIPAMVSPRAPASRGTSGTSDLDP